MDARVLTENDIARAVFECSLRLHRKLGSGLLESAYEECLYYELCKSGFFVENQKGLPLVYEEVKLDVGYRFNVTLLKDGVRRVVNNL